MINKENLLNGMEFKCSGDDFEDIPLSILEKKSISLRDAHSSRKDMSILSKELSILKKDPICKLPFCLTVEAEALGAKVNLGDNNVGPRISGYAFNSLEELKDIEPLDFSKGRIKEVLEAIKILSDEGEVVCLNIEGPFTIISSLIDSTVLYKAIRKNKNMVEKVLEKIEENIVLYAIEAEKMGAKIISYGDPLGEFDIVGPRIYKEISGIHSINTLTKLKNHLRNVIISVCGRMTTSLLKIDAVTLDAIEYCNDAKYGDGIIQLIKGEEASIIIGYNCIKRTHLKMKDNIIWNIKFK